MEVGPYKEAWGWDHIWKHEGGTIYGSNVDGVAQCREVVLGVTRAALLQ